MRPFDPSAKCIRCGYHEASCEYISEHKLLNGKITVPEHIVRRCLRCDYDWAEEPLKLRDE